MRIFSTLTFLFLTYSSISFGKDFNKNIDTVTEDSIICNQGIKVEMKPEIDLIRIHLTGGLMPDDWQAVTKHRSVTGKKLHCATFRAGEVLGIISTTVLISCLIIDTLNYSYLNFKERCLLTDSYIGSIAGIGIAYGLLHIGSKFEDKYPVRFGLFVRRRQLGIACNF